MNDAGKRLMLNKTDGNEMNKKRVPIFFQQFRFTVDTVGEMARKVVASGKS